MGLWRLLRLGHCAGGVVAEAYGAQHPGGVERLGLASTLAGFQAEQQGAMEKAVQATSGELWFEDAMAALQAEQAGEWGTDEELAGIVLRELPFYFDRYGDREQEYVHTLDGEIPVGDALKLFNDEVF